MVEKPKKARVAVTLTQHYIDGMNHLIVSGIFIERQDAIRAGLRLLFDKYDLDPFNIPEPNPDKIIFNG